MQAGVLNYAEKLRGVQVSLINICGKDSEGVQGGVINWRMGVPWYATLIPIIAIRTGKKKSIEDKVK